MRYATMFVVSATLCITEVSVTAISAPALPRPQNSAQQKAASLRAQLAEIEAKQSDLQTRLQKLEEDLKPENIEHGLAGVGSTHPEDLREQRRRQLEIERNGVRAQLDLLATSHTRLETAIAQADADAYRQSAASVTTAAISGSSTTAVSSRAATTATRRPRRVRKRRVSSHTR